MVNTKDIVTNIKAVAEKIKGIETEAENAIHLKGDKQLYRSKLMEKTDLLIGLLGMAQLVATSISDKRQRNISKALLEIAEDAAEAKEIDSIFYMSALLYPVDYKKGEPNELETLIVSLEDSLPV